MGSKKVKVVDTAKTDPKILFAIGDKEGEFYFIKPPKDTEGLAYHNILLQAVNQKRRPLVDIFMTGGRNASLIMPKSLDSVCDKSIIEKDKTTESLVEAKIVPVDLYSIIKSAKEEHFKQYGKEGNWFYEERMTNLAAGNPQKRLQEDKFARDLVRAILTHDKATRYIFGENPIIGIAGSDFVRFPGIPDKAVQSKLYDLMCKDGLVDISGGGCMSVASWCFSSELIIESAGKGMLRESYKVNNPLRTEIRKMLEPFKAERPSFESGYESLNLFR